MVEFRKKLPNLTIEGVELQFRNFAGKEGPMNALGNRNFCVLIDPESAANMIADGWNVKQLKPREEGDVPQDYIKVKLNFETQPGQRPPQVVLVAAKGQTKLTEDMIDMLDWVVITNADLTISAYAWGPNARGESGITAYCYSLYVTIQEDELALKYSNVPDSALSTLPVGPRFIGEDEEN